MAKPKEINNNIYKATGDFKKLMANKGLLSEEQFKKLKKGESVDLSGVPFKQLNYLTVNNLVKN